MSRSGTVSLLNETDDLERRMRWIEFQQEISFVWEPRATFLPTTLSFLELAVSGRTPDNWRPGIPLRNKPLGQWVGEQVPRPMCQELYPELWHMKYRSEPTMWCVECEVGWEDAALLECWNCYSTKHVDQKKSVVDHGVVHNIYMEWILTATLS